MGFVSVKYAVDSRHLPNEDEPSAALPPRFCYSFHAVRKKKHTHD